MRRPTLWLQLLIGWLPVWALYAALIVVAHPGNSIHSAIVAGFYGIVPAAGLGILVSRFAARHPWPRPFRASFLMLHLVTGAAYSAAWFLSSLALGGLFSQVVRVPHGYAPPATAFLIMGFWMYAMVAGVSYAIDGAARTARAEAAATASQLATLRSQLHPHFLFNTLHTVVHLVPHAPAQAQEAAEQLAGLLRTTIGDARDAVTLEEEWSFVSRYLALERLRFGDRLVVRETLDAQALACTLPAFAVQTLVENAIVHGAAPRVEPTTITVTARATDRTLTVDVDDDGMGLAPAPSATSGTGTGLARLRERLAVLYGAGASLTLAARAGGGTRATLVVPRVDDAQRAEREGGYA
jgi:hypothetical protein